MTTRDAAPGAPGASQRHVPVMLEPVLDLLGPVLGDGGVHVDGTLGMGGHAEAVLERHPGVRVVAIDRDPLALELAQVRLAPFADRVDYAHATNDEIGDVLDDLGIAQAQSMFFDLGVSSFQLDEAERGFAYAQDAPLDMRMDQRRPDHRRRGPQHLRRARALPGAPRVRRGALRPQDRPRRRPEREQSPFETSARLVELLRSTIPMASQRGGGHPAKRTFQALRIEVNAELAVWARALPEALARLAVGGRIAVLSFHSLEDRITKRGLAAGAASTAPAGLPVELEEHAPELRLLTRGAATPDAAELAANPRSASVRLRAAERIRPPRRAPHPERTSR
jgi:16S rRNA (cytosine1402-N4)-methyltransferase